MRRMISQKMQDWIKDSHWEELPEDYVLVSGPTYMTSNMLIVDTFFQTSIHFTDYPADHHHYTYYVSINDGDDNSFYLNDELEGSDTLTFLNTTGYTGTSNTVKIYRRRIRNI